MPLEDKEALFDNGLEHDEQSAVAVPYGTSPQIPRDKWLVLEADANISSVSRTYDGLRDTRWSTSTGSPNTTPLPRYFVLDLGISYTVDRMTIDNDWQGIGEYSIAMSNNPSQLGNRTIASIMSNVRPSSFTFNPPLTGRYFLLEILKPFHKPTEAPLTYAYVSELTLDGVEATDVAHAKRCEGEPLTISWEYPADAELLIDKFQLWYRNEEAGTVQSKFDIDKSKRSITFPCKFNGSPEVYYSMIVMGKNSVGVIWESSESNQLCIAYDPNRPWCQDKPQEPPVIGVGS